MTLAGRLAALLSPTVPAAGRCAACRSFEADPRAIEAALPGLAVLSSAQASVTGDDGLCAHHGRFASAHAGCAAFTRR